MVTKQEEEYLEQVRSLLETAIQENNLDLAHSIEDIAKMHDYYWKNYNEFDEFGYEDFDNRQNLQTTVNSKQEQVRKQLMLKKMMDSPYFGRVDFYYEDEDEEETYYIGIGNFSTHYGGRPVIFDWRAPVSSLFYDFDKGPAYFDAPGGRMEGEVLKKKQYQIKKGKLLCEFESDIKIDDDILMQELSQNANTRLKSIVTTIQKEQNEIIRNKKNKILVVQGAAGSGKTSIALHRVAYLLYHNRNRIKASNVLILSPSSIFSDYISHILPELGEENIREMSFDVFAWKELKEYGEVEDRYDYMERILLGGETQDMRYRQSKEFAIEIQGFLLELESDIVNFRDFKYKNMYISADEIADFFYTKFPDIPILKRLEAIGEYMIHQEEAIRGVNLDEVETEIIYEKFNRMYRTKNVKLLYKECLERLGLEDRLDDVILYEDAFAMLYLKYCLEGAGTHREMKHVVVDEMQDYSYIQYLIIKRIFKCSMTILGDKEQTLTEHKTNMIKMLKEIFGKEIGTAVMNKSYRSNYEIATYAAGFIGKTDVSFYPRHGNKPIIFSPNSFEEMLKMITKESLSETEFDTIGIICKSMEEAVFLYECLKDSLPITLLTKDSMRFVKGIVITTYYLAKGLEFDTVHIPYAKRADRMTPLEKQIMYLSATRALHSLKIYEVESFV